MRIRGLAILTIAPLWAESGMYVGAEVCGRCHPAQYRRQSASEHASALFPAAKHPMAASFSSRVPLRRAPGYDYRIVLDNRGLLVRVASADGAIVLPLEWAFGAAGQAVTFVTRTGPSQYLEFYFTYFTATAQMGVTPGQEKIEVRNLEEAAGFVHRDLDGVQCFECHSTGPVDISGGVFRPHEAGVRCEACHGPGGDHARDPRSGSIRNPRRLSSDALNDLCGKCHRLPPAKGAAFDWNNPWNVRFAPAYLSQSACFRNSKGRLSCLTCHDPHGPLRRNDAAHYNAVCAACHTAAHPDRTMLDCTGCHMPEVSPREPLRFRNHWIQVTSNHGRANLKPIHPQPK